MQILMQPATHNTKVIYDWTSVPFYLHNATARDGSATTGTPDNKKLFAVHSSSGLGTAWD